jgi:ATP-dependent RNA helicase RhlE
LSERWASVNRQTSGWISADVSGIMGEMTEAKGPSVPQHPVATTDQSFAALGLSDAVLRCVTAAGFLHPTPIQAAVIPLALAGRDLIGLAETGSGKTAAFVIPVAERLTHGEGVRGLILAPTREIALQTKAFLDIFGVHHELRTVCLIGGVKIGPQIDDLRRKPDIVVATPGRLVDHLERGTLRIDRVRELVLDEGDHMLDMGFLPQVERILRSLPRERHTMLFSATMPGPIERLAKRFMHDPQRVDITPAGRAATGIQHRLYLVNTTDKKACLLALLHQELGSTLVFIRRKMDADWLFRVLQKEGHPVDVIHSDRTQGQRVDALEGFREGEHRILVATDIAARGIDVRGIQHVINFEIPETVDDYIHRGGRTARVGTLGLVSTIASWMDKPRIREIEQALGQKLPRCTVPGVEPYVETKPRGRSRTGRPLRR